NAIAVSDLLIGPTGAFLREFQRLHGEAGAARKIWNGCDAQKFRSAPKQYGVLAAGRLWDSAKNISLLCDAARELDGEIAVAGDIAGPDGESIAANNVVLLGKLAPDELAARMAETAIFAAPARYEPFGLTILEAALSGCALVLGDIPSLRELWDDAAVFIDPSDVAGLRDALRMLRDDPARVAQLASKSEARAAIFTASRMARAYHDAYRALSGYTLEAVA
ncbi:MAG TPA: glycosyltransferase family 4 protein, partial [Micropepsaceae bacterium]|nr:glycosyltransferase family 4 protein [Micropepsaceae bacterium]